MIKTIKLFYNKKSDVQVFLLLTILNKFYNLKGIKNVLE